MVELYAPFSDYPVRVSRLGFGLGLGGNFGRSDRFGGFMRALQVSVELGNNHIDSAQNYGAGQSEEIVRSVSKRNGESLLIATKIGPSDFGEGRVLPAIEKSILRLGVDAIPLLYLHWPNPSVPLGATLLQIEKAFLEGKIRGLGLSNFSISDISRAAQLLGPGILKAIQVEYNLFDRTPELDYFPLAESLGIPLVAYSPLDQGNIVGSWKIRQKIDQIAASEGLSPGQLALNWLLQKSPAFLIPSTQRVRRVRENFRSGSFQVSARAIEQLDEMTKPEIVQLMPSEIEVSADATSRRGVYLNLEAAVANSEGFCPSPLDLAAALEKGEKLKPIRVFFRPSEKLPYLLTEGRIRYWAHILALGPSAPIAALVRD